MIKGLKDTRLKAVAVRKNQNVLNKYIVDDKQLNEGLNSYQ